MTSLLFEYRVREGQAKIPLIHKLESLGRVLRWAVYDRMTADR